MSQDVKKTNVIKEDEFKISLKLNSIIMLIGPDGDGKTQFAMEQLMLQLKLSQTGNKRISISYISLKQILSELLDKQQVVEDSLESLQVIEQARDIAFNKIKNLSSYPVNSDFIIVDSNGFDEVFRQGVLDIGELNHYNVSVILFHYSDKTQFYIVNPENGEQLRPFPHQIKQLKQAASGGILKKDFSSFHVITQRDFDRYQISVEDYSLYDQYILPDNEQFIIVGDIHGCLREFQMLLRKNGFEIDCNLKITHPEGKKIILVGDIIDKGYDIMGVIDFIYANLDILYMVMGNHESLVYKKLSGTLKKGGLPSSEVVGEFFNTIEMLQEPQKPVMPREPKEGSSEDVLKKHQELVLVYEEQMAVYLSIPSQEFERRKVYREKLFKIAESMKSFYIHKNFIVTHSPCEKKFLGKITSAALKATRDFRYPKMRDFSSFAEFIYEFDERVRFLKEESNDSHPIHVFGHVMTKEVSRYKNKINIDTGCVSGGKLTSIEIKDRSNIVIEEVEYILEAPAEKKRLHNFF